MEALAAGEMTFEPVSNARADLMRSVRYLVFRGPDHDWLPLSKRQDFEIYYKRILDKLTWPEGLSRIELVDRFGQGMSSDDVQNMSAMGRPPHWLLPASRSDEHGHQVMDLGNGEVFRLESGEFEMGDDFEDDREPIVSLDPSVPNPGDEAKGV